jgi:hypothetical protein
MRLFGRRRSERSREKRIRRWSFKRKKKPSRKMDKKTLSELSKLMAYILRHDKKHEFQVDLDENCYAKVDQLVKAISSTGKWRWVNRKHVEEVADKSFYHGKKRFVIKGDKIKATYRITRKCPSTPTSTFNNQQWTQGPVKTHGEKTAEDKISKQQAPIKVLIERTIYDPYHNKFIISRPQDLPQVREWIEQRDLSAYWFIVSIRNDTNEDIKGWGIELEMKPSLMVVQALILGIEGDQKHEITTERPWDSKKYGAGVSSDAGIVISPRTTRQIYFKLRSDRPKTDYTINGVFKCANFEPIQIKPKSFTFWCDAVTLRDAIKTNPEVARNCVETELGRRYPDKIIERLANSFRIILDIRSSYCNTDTKAKEINKEFDLLKMYLTEREFLDEIESIQRRISAELREDERLDDNHVEEVKGFCEKFTEMWIARFLR